MTESKQTPLTSRINETGELVSQTQLLTSPWQSLCRVDVYLKNTANQWTRYGIGTGWLASRNTVITAAHVILDSMGRFENRKINLYFPTNGYEFNDVEVAYPSGLLFHRDQYTRNDISALKLDRDIDIPVLKSASIIPDSGNAVIAGFQNKDTFVTHLNKFFSPDNNILLHRIYTKNGHSGAPMIYRNRLGEDKVIGLHVGGIDWNPYKVEHARHNVALRIDSVAGFIGSQV